jgi:hypothetical protein
MVEREQLTSVKKELGELRKNEPIILQAMWKQASRGRKILSFLWDKLDFRNQTFKNTSDSEN